MSGSPKKSAFWTAVITSVAICALMMVVGAVISLARGRAERASLIADFQSGKLSTPEAFQARCGNALSVDITGDETTLSYSYHDLLVKLRPGAPVRFFLNRAIKSNGESHRVEVAVSEDFALDHLECK